MWEVGYNFLPISTERAMEELSPKDSHQRSGKGNKKQTARTWETEG